MKSLALGFFCLCLLMCTTQAFAEEGDFADDAVRQQYYSISDMFESAKACGDAVFEYVSSRGGSERGFGFDDTVALIDGETPPDDGPVVVGTCATCGTNPGHADTCTQNAPGKVCKTVENADLSVTKYCCDWSGPEGNESCGCTKEYKNPCSTPADCLKCMIYAEAGGSTAGGTPIPQACRVAVKCAIQERVRRDDNLSSYCEVAETQQGDTTHFEPYKCVCDSKQSNQKYCKCCSGNLSEEEQEAVDEAEQAANAQCPLNPRPTGYNSTGTVPSGCTAVPVKGCPSSVMTFYRC
ncbi:MAG: hypothetical protein KDD66_16070 [Bdellovibrionales bacterium]|nr:hypothetical protein [Bdellovibrionales bacterium]